MYCRLKRGPTKSTSAGSRPGKEGDKTSQSRASSPIASCSHCFPVDDSNDRGEEPSNSSQT